MPKGNRSRAPERGTPKPPPWGARPIVVLAGGPRDGWWLFAEGERSLAASRRAAESMGRPWPYAATGEYRAHPLYDAAGEVHTYRGAA